MAWYFGVFSKQAMDPHINRTIVENSNMIVARYTAMTFMKLRDFLESLVRPYEFTYVLYWFDTSYASLSLRIF